jgi:SAM-dependent methyltransferase
MSARDRLRDLVPYPLVEAARKAFWFGLARRCDVCGAHLRRMLAQGYGYPMLERLRVVGGMYRADDRCPVCHASDRDRLIGLYLAREVFPGVVPGAGKGFTVLHFAPEKGLSKLLRARPGIVYRAGDIEPGRYRHMGGVERIDLLEGIPAEAGSIDLLLCCHVLEHIPDDLAAMREIARVLSPRGRALLQVPLALGLDRTVEGDGTESAAEKIRRYGQRDHVRIYAADDYPRRLAQAGMRVELWNAFEADEAEAARLRLNPFERLHVCRPAPVAAPQTM